MLNLMREVFAEAVTCTALDDLIRIVHLYGDFGIGVCKYPAFINNVLLLCRVPPFYPVPASGVILRELHQAQVGKIM